MKKSLVVMALVLVCAMLLPCFVSAVNFTKEADALHDMGLFLGTNNGYDLDKKPTRAQAAVMLVRFLGKVDEALGLEWTAPFKDVPDWAKPYVQYLYTAGLTVGYSDTVYAPDDDCSAQMYTTFMLRSLGYMDIDPEANKPTEVIDDGGEPVFAFDDPTNAAKATVAEMHYEDYYQIGSDSSSIVDAWPSFDSRFDRGITYMASDEGKTILSDAILASSNGQTVDGLQAGSALPMADTDMVYIFNGKIGDADFGTKVAENLYDKYGACLAYLPDSPYFWVGGLWRTEADRNLDDGIYTFVLYAEDGSAVAFTDYIWQNFYEAKGYTYTQGGASSSEDAEFVPAFTYAEALDFGRQIGLITDNNCDTENFLRDHMVAIAYTALGIDVYGVERTGPSLIQKLWEEGIVTEEQMEKYFSHAYTDGEEGPGEEPGEGPVHEGDTFDHIEFVDHSQWDSFYRIPLAMYENIPTTEDGAVDLAAVTIILGGVPYPGTQWERFIPDEGSRHLEEGEEGVWKWEIFADDTDGDGIYEHYLKVFYSGLFGCPEHGGWTNETSEKLEFTGKDGKAYSYDFRMIVDWPW